MRPPLTSPLRLHASRKIENMYSSCKVNSLLKAKLSINERHSPVSGFNLTHHPATLLTALFSVVRPLPLLLSWLPACLLVCVCACVRAYVSACSSFLTRQVHTSVCHSEKLPIEPDMASCEELSNTMDFLRSMLEKTVRYCVRIFEVFHK